MGFRVFMLQMSWKSGSNVFSPDPEAEKRWRPEVGQLLGQCPVLEAGLDLGVQGSRVLTCHLVFRV